MGGLADHRTAPHSTLVYETAEVVWDFAEAANILRPNASYIASTVSQVPMPSDPLGRRSYGQIVERVLKFCVAGHPRTDGVELRLLQSWGSGRTPSWLTTIWAA